MSDETPTSDQLAYASEVLDRWRNRALVALVTGQHLDHVAGLVFDFNDSEDGATSGEVAGHILDYVAREVLAPLLAGGSPGDAPNDPPHTWGMTVEKSAQKFIDEVIAINEKFGMGRCSDERRAACVAGVVAAVEPLVYKASRVVAGSVSEDQT